MMAAYSKIISQYLIQLRAKILCSGGLQYVIGYCIQPPLVSNPMLIPYLEGSRILSGIGVAVLEFLVGWVLIVDSGMVV